MRRMLVMPPPTTATAPPASATLPPVRVKFARLTFSGVLMLKTRLAPAASIVISSNWPLIERSSVMSNSPRARTMGTPSTTGVLMVTYRAAAPRPAGSFALAQPTAAELERRRKMEREK